MENFSDVLYDVSLKEYSTLKVGGVCKYFVRPKNEEELLKLLKYIKDNNLKYYVLGNLSNVILDDSYFDGVIIRFDHFDEIIFENEFVTAGCGVMLPKLVSKSLEKGYVSLANFSMIPGTVGASVVGNAGCFQSEIMQYVDSVRVLTLSGEIKNLEKKDITYAYRFTSLKNNYIVLSVKFKLEKGDVNETINNMKENIAKRKATQPLDKKSVGSIFKNPEGLSAGMLIDSCNLKGYQIGGAKVSEKHANFIVNEDNATFSDVIKLISYVQDKVKKEKNVTLDLEPQVVIWDNL